MRISRQALLRLSSDPRVVLLGRTGGWASSSSGSSGASRSGSSSGASGSGSGSSSSGASKGTSSDPTTDPSKGASVGSSTGIPVESPTPATGPSATDTDTAHHLPIFSFLIRCGVRFLHHNFVCALLNDLFGVQSRGGCQCAGPFSQQLLGLTAASNQQIESALLDKHEVLRPGYSRLSLTYWMSAAEVQYVLDSVLFVAAHGYKFLPLYR